MTRQREEEALHLAVAHYLRVALPPDFIWTSIEHGGHKVGKAEAGKRKARGCLAGWPDIQIMPPVAETTSEWASLPAPLFVELKSAKGRVSNAQKDVHHRLMDAGYDVCVARSVEDVERWLRSQGVPLRATTGAM